jgi:hypothetical protein
VSQWKYGLTDSLYAEMHERAEKNAARILASICESVVERSPLLHRDTLKGYLSEVQTRFVRDIRRIRRD